MTTPMRLQKYIADCGITSRRKAEQMIVNGEVKVNGLVCRELGTKVDPDHDSVEVGGQVLNLLGVEKLYVLLNKPRGVVTTVSDPEGRATVIDYCRGIDMRIYPVGRLDYHSEGLLILTNDGEMANMIMHPRYDVTKVYEVKIFGQVTESILNKLKNGMQFPEGFVKPKSVRVLEILPNKTWVEFRLSEGKNREIRRLCEACGLTIDKLRRVAIEGLTIQGLAPGNYRMLSKKELMKALNINADGSKKVQTGYISEKKTINLKEKVSRRAMLKRRNPERASKVATDPSFSRYRKENYKETIELHKKIAAEKAEAEMMGVEYKAKKTPEKKSAPKKEPIRKVTLKSERSDKPSSYKKKSNYRN